MRQRWRLGRTFTDADGTWTITEPGQVSTPQSRMFEEIRRERGQLGQEPGEYRGIVTWRYEGPDLGPRYPYENQVRDPNE